MREEENIRVLLVDDQQANLDVLRRVLEADGYRVLLAPNGQIALNSAARVVPDLVLLDVMMPEMDGFEVCRRLKSDPATQAIPIIFITARDLQEDITAGFGLGAVDYITKPFQEHEVLMRVRVHTALHRLNRQLQEKNAALEEEISQRQKLSGQLSMISAREVDHWGLEGFVGQSPTIQQIFKQIRLMQENAVTSVLITGESGTGKELIARAVHYGGPRKDAPFIPVNCAAMPGNLTESLLFGHAKGAFTGATTDHVGYFEMAHEGTLFLDEVGDMPLELQAKLLRVLEGGEIWRVGETKSRRIDVRVLAATNVDLQRRMHEGAFRQDLYFRLARFTVTAPPLRQRRDDIPLLTEHFLRVFAAEMGREAPAITAAALDLLQTYDFPGNVRELKNLMERALLESNGAPIESHHLHFLPQPGPAPTNGQPSAALDLPMNLEQAGTQAQLWVIKQAMRQTGDNISAATRLLGTNRNRIYRLLAQEGEERVGQSKD
ncbi:MAG: response regulator [Candidatus Latescibacteria bacterium]|nr:response regulator [Candidatus Latescibacterota bacterium]